VRAFSSYLGRRVVTEDGRELGRCRDLRGELTGSSLRVTALVVGASGLLEHFGIGGPRGRRDAVPWEAVVRIDGATIVVRDGTEPG
jgi:sporulation protein YlmC with PRC-barrel domain